MFSTRYARLVVSLLVFGVLVAFGRLLPLHASQVNPTVSDAECRVTNRACFDVRVELLERDEFPLDGFYDPPRIRARAIEMEVYRQLLMDRTPFTCSSIGGADNLLSLGGDVRVSYIVTPAEAYRSGLSAREIPDFLSDTLNLTVLTGAEERDRGASDAGSFLPERNSCWYVWHYLMVKQRWLLAVDEQEARVLARVFSGCYPERFARVSCIDAYAAEDLAHRARGGL